MSVPNFASTARSGSASTSSIATSPASSGWEVCPSRQERTTWVDWLCDSSSSSAAEVWRGEVGVGLPRRSGEGGRIIDDDDSERKRSSLAPLGLCRDGDLHLLPDRVPLRAPRSVVRTQ